MRPSPYRVTFTFANAYREHLRPRVLAALVRRALALEKVSGPLSVGIAISSDAVVRDLNRRFRGQDTATDVLSFGHTDRSGFISAEGVPQLGDIIISFPTAKRQAREEGHSVEDEMAHLLVHGVLHLLGYDHERPRDAKVMRAREDALLGRAAH